MLTPPPPDSQTTSEKFNVANFDPHDIRSEAPGPVYCCTKRKMVQTTGKGISNEITISADVHCSGGESTSSEDNVQSDVPSSQQQLKAAPAWYKRAHAT